MDQIIQIAGALVVLAAFLLAQADVLDARSYRYLVPNAAGSGVMAATAVITQDWGFVFLEGVWALVSCAGIVGRLRRPGDPVAHRADGGPR
jgi:hypothetical protein